MSVPGAGASVAAEVRRIKVWFRFVPREGWLPHDREGLWAVPVGADTARIENVPFLQDGVARGDIVRFTTDADGVHWAVGQVAPSGGCTIRVLPVPDGPLGRSAAAVHERMAEFGLGGEAFSEEFPLVAFDVPADADLRSVKAMPVRGQDAGWWYFEEGCVTEAWRAA
ncbi:hypothetical protein GCM10023205_44290 [Yinghuangia aomiensis]|uniref:DUF4265 domain-containing protein n=1 Tax=Yinghuangia aomiensis TaxID=676205 RepID=A0ABP9HL23_9ACTN